MLSNVEKQILNLSISLALKPDNSVVLDLVSATANNNKFEFPCLNGIIISNPVRPFLDDFVLLWINLEKSTFL